MKTIECSVSKANLEAALTENILRQFGFVANNEELEDVKLELPDVIPLKFTIKGETIN